MSTGLKANSDGSAAIQVGGTDVITLTSSGAATFVTSPTTVQAGTAAAPAITTSGDTNTGIFFPAADTIAFAEGGVESMRIDSSGNLGLGVTPSASTTFPALEIGAGNCFLGFGNSFLDITYNAFYNGSYKYKATGAASYYEQTGGSHIWFRAPSGTAGNAITFTQAMTLDASGNLGIGTSSPSFKLDTIVTTGNAIAIRPDSGSATGLQTALRLYGHESVTTSRYVQIGCINNGGTDVNNLGFYTGSGTSVTERARITSGGILLINTTAAIEGASNLQVRGGIMGDNSSGDANFAIEARGVGTLYSDSIYSSTTAAGASVSITGTAGYLQRSTSSIKYKTNVEDLDQSRSEVIFQMRPVWYRSICELDRKDWSYYGLIAEEVAEIEPRLVHWGKVKEDGSQEPEGVMYDRLTVLLLTEMKKLKAELDATKAEVAALKGTA